MSVRIGVDTGGTFTDCVLMRSDGSALVRKLPSTPADPSAAILAGIEAVCREAGVALGEVEFVGHGTTVATNAMLQGDWARVGLITTEGFRDVLEIGTQMRPRLYGLQQRKRPPIVPRERRLELSERVDFRGEVVTQIDRDQARAAVEQLVAEGIESLAVSLLFSFARPEHERIVRELAAEVAPDLYVAESARVCPELREYPRTSTTVVNAALAPVIRDYVRRLRAGLAERCTDSELLIMQANGGMVSGGDAEGAAHRLILSGPTAGVNAAAAVARAVGHDDVLTLDMGGTSTDVALVRDGAVRLRPGMEAGGHPVQAPTADLHTIGAGGGSIAWRDGGGSLRIGPRSAGAVPGPACYGKGGTQPTITDAHVLLGRIGSDELLGGSVAVDCERSRTVLGALATELGLEAERAAWGIVAVANASMAAALRVVSSGRGHDPRDFALVAYGGAGPLHATGLARELGIREVIVPTWPGALSGVGLLLSDVRHDHARPHVELVQAADDEALERAFAELEQVGGAQIESANGDGRLERYLDLRYQGQEHALTVPAGDARVGVSLDEATARFHAEHERTYGHAAAGEPVEIVSLRVSAVRAVGAVAPDAPQADGAAASARTRHVYFDGHDWLPTPILRRASLRPGDELDGPAIVEQPDTTIVVEPGQLLRVRDGGTIVIEVGGKR